jgi:predicted acetyltransferase
MEIRPPDDDELEAYRASMLGTFGADPGSDPQGAERLRALVERDRVWAAFDGKDIVATAGTFTLTMTVPGGTVPMAGLTMVTVRPTHRRRGLLRALMKTYFDDLRAHGEAIGGLWASESSIYGRFGFGVAAESEAIAVDTRAPRAVAVAPGATLDDVRMIDAEAIPALFGPVYDRARLARVGMLARSDAWWKYRRAHDAPLWREGATTRRHVAAMRDGEVTGWVSYRHRSKWRDDMPEGFVEIEELVGIDGRAEASLWRFALEVDLFPRVAYRLAPVDSVLPHLVAEPRRVTRRRCDSMYLCLDDVEKALAARRYDRDGQLRIEVRDAPGTPGYRLEIEGGVGRCVRDDASPDLSMDRATLGSIFLGTFPPSQLARAGRIQGTPAALALADRAFRVDAPPWCVEQF